MATRAVTAHISANSLATSLARHLPRGGALLLRPPLLRLLLSRLLLSL